MFFWNATDLARKLHEFKDYYNSARFHRGLAGVTPTEQAGGPSAAPATLSHYGWHSHCRGLFQIPIPT